MEYGSLQDPSQATFSITEEDHTVANALRYALNQNPRVTFVGYSIPHPSDARGNIRVQTTGYPAREVLKDSCQDLMSMCETGVSTFEQEVIDFKKREGVADASEYFEEQMQPLYDAINAEEKFGKEQLIEREKVIMSEAIGSSGQERQLKVKEIVKFIQNQVIR